ncbi:MAG: hypothetical protein OXC97_06675 [Candidatus Dadabacteria bacterium]|nr:hypothetical protein [Candidatus Dadabacteria bacterium]
MSDRGKLLSDIESLLSGTEKPSTPDSQQLLDSWHQESEKRFLELLPQNQNLTWPVEFNNHRCQLSYMISLNGDEAISHLSQALIEVNNKVLNTIRTGWSMFYSVIAPEFAPRIVPEKPDGTGKNVLEANYMNIEMLSSYGRDLWIPEFWRITPDGCASLIRGYMEDRSYSNKTLGRTPGTWLSPETVIRETAELVTHAKEFAKYFNTAVQVSFRCTWMGLGNRKLLDFHPSSDYFRCHEAQTDKRTTEKTYDIVELEAKWSTVVSDLSEPVLSLFGFEYCSPEFIENMKSQFIKIK